MNCTIDFVQQSSSGRIIVTDVPCDATGALDLDVAERLERILDAVKATTEHGTQTTVTVPYREGAVDA